MFGPFDILILNIVLGLEIRISALSVMKILLLDEIIIYYVITVNMPTIELTAALDCSMVSKIFG
jgi:hypothetical protein